MDLTPSVQFVVNLSISIEVQQYSRHALAGAAVLASLVYALYRSKSCVMLCPICRSAVPVCEQALLPSYRSAYFAVWNARRRLAELTLRHRLLRIALSSTRTIRAAYTSLDWTGHALVT